MSGPPEGTSEGTEAATRPERHGGLDTLYHTGVCESVTTPVSVKKKLILLAVSVGLPPSPLMSRFPDTRKVSAIGL